MAETSVTVTPRLEGAAFLSAGFRPFFLVGGIWAAAVIVLFGEALVGRVAWPGLARPVEWHRHEMMFGFVGSVIAGFLLTAAPKWADRPSVKGSPLAALFSVWLCARAAVLTLGVGTAVAALFDLAFLLSLTTWIARIVLPAGVRNVPVAILPLILAIACGVDHAEAAGMLHPNGIGHRLGISVVVTMMTVIGGRIVPAFTRNWLQARGSKLKVSPLRIDPAVVGVTAGAMLWWTFAPATTALSAAFALAALLHIARLWSWRGWTTWRSPLLLVLHVTYAWLPASFALMSASLVGLLPASAALHAFTAGAIGGMTIAVMSRASLGHTGRPLRAGPATLVVYVVVLAAALARVAAPLLSGAYLQLLHIASGLWVAAFSLFVLAYGPALLTRRLDERS